MKMEYFLKFNYDESRMDVQTDSSAEKEARTNDHNDDHSATTKTDHRLYELEKKTDSTNSRLDTMKSAVDELKQMMQHLLFRTDTSQSAKRAASSPLKRIQAAYLTDEDPRVADTESSDTNGGDDRFRSNASKWVHYSNQEIGHGPSGETLHEAVSPRNHE